MSELARLRMVSEMMKDYQSTINRALDILDTREPGSNTVPVTPATTIPITTQDEIFIETFLNTPLTQTPIESGYTREEIQTITTTTTLSDTAAASSSEEERCPITFETFVPGQQLLRINHCGHLFSKNALEEWFKNHRQCPVCRGVPPEIPAPSSRANQSLFDLIYDAFDPLTAASANGRTRTLAGDRNRNRTTFMRRL